MVSKAELPLFSVEVCEAREDGTGGCAERLSLGQDDVSEDVSEDLSVVSEDADDDDRGPSKNVISISMVPTCFWEPLPFFSRVLTLRLMRAVFI